MNAPKFLRDKRILAAGGVGAVALVALYMRRGSGAAASSKAAAGGVGTIGAYDSSPTDAYANFSATLSQYGDQISALQAQLAGMGQAQPPTPPATDTVTHRGVRIPVAAAPRKRAGRPR